MGEQNEWGRLLIEKLNQLLRDESSLHFRDFLQISDSLMEAYARLAEQGVPGQAIAFAMMGATINIFDMFEMREELPSLFRSLADKIESEGLTH